MARSPLVIAAAARPYPGETVSGDAWQVDRHNGVFRLTVIDGLGHGELAAQAASAAKQVLANHPELPPADALRACHEALYSTRGAAIWMVAIELERERVSYVGAGNVEARLWQGNRQRRLAAQRGIVGATLPTVRVYEHQLEPGWVLLVHTDGIRDRFETDMLPESMARDPQALANGILQTWGRETDDALVVVVAAGLPARGVGAGMNGGLVASPDHAY